MVVKTQPEVPMGERGHKTDSEERADRVQGFVKERCSQQGHVLSRTVEALIFWREGNVLEGMKWAEPQRAPEIYEEQFRKQGRAVCFCLVAGTVFFHGFSGGDKILFHGNPKLSIIHILETAGDTQLRVCI